MLKQFQSAALNSSIQDKSLNARAKKESFGNLISNKDMTLSKDGFERDSVKKLSTGLASDNGVGLTSSITRKPPLTDSHSEPNLNMNAVRSSIERLEQKTESHMNKIERSIEFL